MHIKKAINDVLKDEKVKPLLDNSYLVHYFRMVEKDKEFNQLGLYNPEHDRIIPIEIDEELKINEEAEAFKKSGKIPKLNLDNVKIDIDEAIKKANDIQKEKYSKHDPMKLIVILQHLDQEMYNISFVTRSFKTLNIKIDANSGEVINELLTSIFEFKK